MKFINILLESIFDDIDPDLFKKAYIGKINKERDNLIEKGSKDPNFEFVLGSDMKYKPCGNPNQCETNSFQFVKDRLKNGEDYWYPVGGFGFEGKNLFPVEHWWVYNKKEDKNYEVSPLYNNEKFRCYAGIINYDINDDILKANKFHDVDFFKGGNVEHKYFK